MSAKVKKSTPKKVKCLHCRKDRNKISRSFRVKRAGDGLTVSQGHPVNGYCGACTQLAGEGVELQGRTKCAVEGCANYTDQGLFVGDFCAPCHDFVVGDGGKYSQAYRNSLKSIFADLSGLLFRVLDPTSPAPSIADTELRKLVCGG